MHRYNTLIHTLRQKLPQTLDQSEQKNGANNGNKRIRTKKM